MLGTEVGSEHMKTMHTSCSMRQTAQYNLDTSAELGQGHAVSM